MRIIAITPWQYEWGTKKALDLLEEEHIGENVVGIIVVYDSFMQIIFCLKGHLLAKQ